MNLIKWIDENLERMILTILLIIMVLVMGIQIVMRYVLNSSLTWSEELTRYLFVWSSFISIGYCIKHGISIKIDQVFNMFPEKVRKIIQILNKLIMIALFIYLTYHSISVVKSAINSGQKSPALNIPMYFVQLSATVGFAIATVRVVQSLAQLMIGTKEV